MLAMLGIAPGIAMGVHADGRRGAESRPLGVASQQQLALLAPRFERVDAVTQLAPGGRGPFPGLGEPHLGPAAQAHVAALAGEAVA